MFYEKKNHGHIRGEVSYKGIRGRHESHKNGEVSKRLCVASSREQAMKMIFEKSINVSFDPMIFIS